VRSRGAPVSYSTESPGIFSLLSTRLRLFRSFGNSVLSPDACLRLQLLHEPIPLTGCRNHYSASMG
jgi:hypothetical protein